MPAEPTRLHEKAPGTAVQTGLSTLPPAGPSDMPPLPADRYSLGDEIGHGGMGTVYTALDAHLGRDVAIKVLNADLAGTAAERRFRDEARITGQLQHPGTPPVYDLGTLPDGRPFLAMKLIKGRTLDAHLKADGHGGRWVGVFEGVCQALAYAHAHGVIHRDLKPANVMVGAFGEVQVMDWGLAKVLASRERQRPEGEVDDPDATAGLLTAIQGQRDGADLTRAGSVLGTPAFMAPEQAIGAVDQLDRRTDVFGLGAILCALLTSRPPFVGGDAESTRQLAARGKLDDTFARLANSGADPDLVGLCVRCLSAEPAGRPADAGEVAAAVAALRAAADDRARRAELTAAEGKVREAEGRKRRRLSLAAGGAVLAVTLAGGAAAGVLWRRAVTQERATADALADKTAEEQAKSAALADAVTARGKTVATLRRLNDELIADKTVARAASQNLATDNKYDPLVLRTPDADRALLQDMLALWEWVAGTAGDNSEALSLRAEGAYRMGLVRESLYDHEEAARAQRTAIGLLEQLTRAEPAVADYRLRLAACQVKLAWVLNFKRPRDLVAVEAALRAAVALQTVLVAESPAESERRSALSRSYCELAMVLQGGRLAEAESPLRLAIQLQEGLVKDFPSDAKHRADLSHTRVRLGWHLERVSRLDAAEVELRAACRLSEQQSNDRTASLDLRRQPDSGFESLSHFLAKTGRQREAVEAGAAGVSLVEKLVADFPNCTKCRLNLGRSYSSHARRLSEFERIADSTLAYDNAIRVLAGLDDTDQWPSAKLPLADAHEKRGASLFRLGRRTEATTDWDRSINLREAYQHHETIALRTIAILRSKLPEQAMVEMNKLARFPNPDGVQRCNLACVYSVASVAIPDKQAEFAGRAVAQLRAAAGILDPSDWVQSVKSDRDLDPIRTRLDFRWLLAKYQAQAEAREPATPPVK